MRNTSQWKITGKKFILHVAIPTNTTAELHMPATTAAQVTEGGDATGVRYRRKGDGVCMYELGSGDYTFAAPFSKTSYP
ncbi:MAG: alpha-L-rhamnosidase C-terminal domain-containing protein [Pirellulales bacterium]